MCILRGCPLLIVTFAVAALLSGCGRTSLPAPSQRAPTMDVSIVVTVEFYDPDESAEVEEAPARSEATTARPSGEAAAMARECAPWALCLLWASLEPSCAGRVLPGGSTPLVSRLAKAESEGSDLESFWTDIGALPLARTPDHSLPGGSRRWPWVTFKRSRVRESRMLGSVRAKAEWLSYSTIPLLLASSSTH